MGRINLIKGSSIDLTKKAPSLRRVSFGTGWEFLRRSFDLDIFAAATNDQGEYVTKDAICFFGQRSILSGAIQVSPDNLTGQGEGVDEELTVNLDRLPENVRYVYIGINIYQGRANNQRFSQLREAFLEIRNEDNNQLIGEYDLDQVIRDYQACILGRLKVTPDNLVFEPLLELFHGDTIQPILREFGLRSGTDSTNSKRGFLRNLFG